MLLVGCVVDLDGLGNMSIDNAYDPQLRYDTLADTVELINKEEVVAEVTKRTSTTDMIQVGDGFITDTSYKTVISYNEYYFKFTDSSTYSRVKKGDHIQAFLYTFKSKDNGKEVTILSLDEQIDLDELMELTDYLEE